MNGSCCSMGWVLWTQLCDRPTAACPPVDASLVYASVLLHGVSIRYPWSNQTAETCLCVVMWPRCFQIEELESGVQGTCSCVGYNSAAGPQCCFFVFPLPHDLAFCGAALPCGDGMHDLTPCTKSATWGRINEVTRPCCCSLSSPGRQLPALTGSKLWRPCKGCLTVHAT